jgi:hypothetical protein
VKKTKNRQKCKGGRAKVVADETANGYTSQHECAQGRRRIMLNIANWGWLSCFLYLSRAVSCKQASSFYLQ